jgi:hypothetical protein
MAVTYTWKVTGLKTTSFANTNNVVVQVYWDKIGNDGLFEGTFSGATPFDTAKIPQGVKLKPFNKLTEEEVISWIQDTVTGAYEEHVNRQISRQIEEAKGTVVSVKLPWIKDEVIIKE